MKEVNSKSILIGYKLKQLRMSNGYTQSKVAEFLGVSPQHYGTLERGVNCFSLDNILKLCDFYDIPISSILGEINRADRKNKKEGERFLQQVDSLNNEHKSIIKHMVDFFVEIENKNQKPKEVLKHKEVSKKKSRVKKSNKVNNTTKSTKSNKASKV